MLDHLARCRAVCFTPLDEDYGFVTVEAFASREGRGHLPRQRRAGRARAHDGETGLVVRRRRRRRWPRRLRASTDDAGAGRAAGRAAPPRRPRR